MMTLDDLKTARDRSQLTLGFATTTLREADAAEKDALERTRALERDLEAAEDRAGIEAATAALASAHVDLRLSTKAHARARADHTSAQGALATAIAALERAVDAQLAAESLEHCKDFERRVGELTTLAQSIRIPGELDRPINYIGPLSKRALRVLDVLAGQLGGLDTPIPEMRSDGRHGGAALAARRRELLGERNEPALSWQEALNTPANLLPKIGEAAASAA
jgi:hypothetical protein